MGKWSNFKFFAQEEKNPIRNLYYAPGHNIILEQSKTTSSLLKRGH